MKVSQLNTLEIFTSWSGANRLSTALSPFQHSPHCVQCMSSSTSPMPRFLVKKNYFRCMQSQSRISSLGQKVIPPTVSLSVTSHRQQVQSELSTHYHSFKPQWNSLDLIPLLTTKQMIESCSSFMIASNRAAIFAHSADNMKSLLPHLLHKVHASNSHWCLTVPTAAHSRVSICFHTFKVFHLTHSLRYMAHAHISYWIFILQTAEHLTTCHLHFRMRWGWSLLCSTRLHPWINLACLFSSKYSDKIHRFHNNVWIAVPHTSCNMHHFSLLLSELSKWYPKGINVCNIFQAIKFAPRTMGEEKFVFWNTSLVSWTPCLFCCLS